MNRGISSLLSIIALIVGVVALLVAIGAYNRTGTDLSNVAGTTAKEAGQKLDREISVLGIETDLLRIQRDIQDQNVTTDTRDLLTRIRNDAKQMNVDTNIQNQMQTLDTQLREGSNNALTTVQNIINDLRKSVNVTK